MPRKKTSQSRALVPVAKPTSYAIANTRIEVLQLHRVRDRHPQGHGPWAGEHEKIAWIDPATGLHCTILRQHDGSLAGWVAVPASHPLFGFEHDAIPADFNLSVHGSLQETQMCDEDGPENVSVCHAGKQSDPLWWFGFTCNHSYDFVPGKGPASLAAENGQTYRTEGYVFEQCSSLARQLDQISEGATPDAGVPLDLATYAPPVGLDKQER